MKSLVFLLPTTAFAALTSITQNDVKNGGGCKPMTVLFARGTTELGNMGSIAGPPFGGDKGGSQLMAQMVGQVRAQCPDTTLVMAGYS